MEGRKDERTGVIEGRLMEEKDKWTKRRTHGRRERRRKRDADKNGRGKPSNIEPNNEEYVRVHAQLQT